MFSWMISLFYSGALATVPEQYPRLNWLGKPTEGLYTGVGVSTPRTSFDLFPQLALQVQYHPLEPLWKPYVDLQLHAAMGPEFQLKRTITAVYNESSDTPIGLNDIDLFWLDYQLQSHLGFSYRIERFFLRMGGAISYQASPGMYEQVSETYDLWVDWTTTLRGGMFLGGGMYIGKGEYLWAPSLSFSYLRGLTTGGGAMRLSEDIGLDAFNQEQGTNFGHHSFAQDLRYISVETHVHHDASVIHILYQYGEYEASAVTEHFLELYGLDDTQDRSYWRINVGTGFLF